MESKPAVVDSKKELWKQSDEMMKRAIEVTTRSLNPNNWTFHLASQNRDLTYNELVNNINQQFVAYEYIDLMKAAICNLPDSLQKTSSDIKIFYTRFAADFQDRIAYMQSLQEYAQSLEEEVKILKAVNVSQAKVIIDLQKDADMWKAQGEASAMKQAFDTLVKQAKTFEIPSEEKPEAPKKEAKPRSQY